MNERQKKSAALRAAKKNTLTKKYYEYILDSIQSDDVDVSVLSDREKLKFAFGIFHKEKVIGESRNIRYVDLLTEWLQGLCSTMGIAYTYYDIRQIGKAWNVDNLNDFVNGWFENVATAMLCLARDLKVNVGEYM